MNWAQLNLLGANRRIPVGDHMALRVKAHLRNAKYSAPLAAPLWRH